LQNQHNDYNSLLLADGRTLCYQLFGDPLGYPVLYCHGFPGSRLEAQLAHKAGCDLGACIIAVDRPGFGHSDFQPDRQMLDWVDVSRTLMDSLGHQQFSVIGISGGSPYAMLIGEYLHSRVHRLGIVCGLGDLSNPSSDELMSLAQRSAIKFARTFHKPALFLNHYPIGTFIKLSPEITFRLLLSAVPQADYAELVNAEAGQIMMDSIREAFAQGGRGPAWDFYLATRQWQCNPAAVKASTFLWHGNLDTTVPVGMGQRHAELIPHCTAEFLPDESHFSLPIKHIKRILATLLP